MTPSASGNIVYAEDEVDHQFIFNMLQSGMGRIAILKKMRTGSQEAYRMLGAKLEKTILQGMNGGGLRLEGSLDEDIWEYMSIVGELLYRPTKMGEAPFDVSRTRADRIICPYLRTDAFLSVVERNLQAAFRERQDPDFTNSHWDRPLPLLAGLPSICPLGDSLLLQHAVLYDRIRSLVTTEPQGVLMTVIPFDFDTILDLIAALPPQNFVNKMKVDVFDTLDASTDPLRAWFRRMVVGIFADDRHFFMESKGVLTMDPVRGFKEEDRVKYFGIGKVLAMALAEGIPIGRELSRGLLRSLIAGGAEHVAWTREDFDLDCNKGICAVLDGIVQTITRGEDLGGVQGYEYMKSLDLKRDLGVPGTRLTAENVDEWAEMAIADFMVNRLNWPGMKALIRGFNFVLPKPILRGVIGAAELGGILRGRYPVSAEDLLRVIRFDEADSSPAAQVVRQVVTQLIHESGAAFRTNFVTCATGLLTAPLQGLSREIFVEYSEKLQTKKAVFRTDTKGQVMTFGAYDFDLKTALLARVARITTVRFDDPFAPTEVLSPLITPRTCPQEVISEVVNFGLFAPSKKFPIGSDGLYAQGLGSFQSASVQAFEKFFRKTTVVGLAELMVAERRDRFSENIIGEMYVALEFIMMILSEFASRPLNALDGDEPFDLGLLPGIGALCASLSSKSFQAFTQVSVTLSIEARDASFGNRGGFHAADLRKSFANELEEFPLAKLPSLCILPGDSFDLERAVLFHRIGRFMTSVQYEREDDSLLNGSPLPYEFDIHYMLDMVAKTSVLKLRNKLQIRYLGKDSYGAGVYKDWFARVFQKLLRMEAESANRAPSPSISGRECLAYFVFDPETVGGANRINPDCGNDARFSRKYFAVGRLFALSVLDSMAIGARFNHGLFWVLTRSGDNDAEKAFKSDNPTLYKRWKDIVDGQRENEEFSMWTFVGLDQFNTPLKPNGENIETTKDNIHEWVQLSLQHYLFETNVIGNTAFAQGFYDILPNGIFDQVMDAASVRHLIQGNLNLEPDVLIAAMDFVDYNSDAQVLETRRMLREMLIGFTPEMRTRFLFFVTGLVVLQHGPIHGTLRIKVHMVAPRVADEVLLPVAHTCFNVLEIPLYSSVAEMRSKFEMALSEIDMTLV